MDNLRVNPFRILCVVTNLLIILFQANCSRASSNYVRLVGGEHPSEGRVEVFYNLEWGTVCDDGWSIYEARVVCNDLGYDGADLALVSAAFGQGSGPIWLDDVHCTGYEPSLFQCDYDRIGVHNCGHQDDASVVCTTRGSLWLGSDDSRHEGVLYIIGDEAATVSHPVCADSWTDASGEVACRQLGYSGYSNTSLLRDSANQRQRTTDHGNGSYLIGFDCHGNETRLEDCPYARWVDSESCYLNALVHLHCDTAVVRLMGGDVPSEGRVEVFYGATWGSVCDDYWDLNDADVVCREVGYDVGATAAPRNSYFGVSNGAILLDNVECTGRETSIFDCPHGGFSHDNCNHYTNAGVVCLPSEDQIRLLSGRSSNEGVVEIWLKNDWGILCDNQWGVQEANVACRQLGRSSVSLMTAIDVGVEVHGLTFSRNYLCDGDEASLNECPWVTSLFACRPQDVVQISCIPVRELETRIVQGHASDQGRLEIYRGRSWGTLNSLGLDEAHVACRQLGYEKVIDVYDDAFFGEGAGAVWDDDIFSCDGSEESLDECTVSDDEDDDVDSLDHSNDVGLLCKPFDSIGTVEVRLVPDEGSVSSTRGRLEVLHDGVWGSICAEEPWSINEVAVVCSQLGHSTGSHALLLPSEFTQGSGNIWLADVRCDENAPSLGHCYHSAWGHGIECMHQQDIGLDCFYVEPADSNSSLIPGWEIAVICIMACTVLAVLVIMAFVQRYRQKGHRRRRHGSMENDTVTDRSDQDVVDWIHGGHMNYLYPPPEYRPPTPPPSEAPPSYEWTLKPEDPPKEVDTNANGQNLAVSSGGNEVDSNDVIIPREQNNAVTEAVQATRVGHEETDAERQACNWAITTGENHMSGDRRVYYVSTV